MEKLVKSQKQSSQLTTRSELKFVHGKCPSVTNYKKVSRIGEGTYGYVYRAIDLNSTSSASSTPPFVALKRIKMHNESHDGFPLTCLREIKTLRRCAGHENIVELVDVVVGKNRDAVFLLFEYCENDLAALLKTWKNPFTESQIKCLTQQLLSALEFCHRKWVVHRDIKLSNLLYNSRGQLKLADFGLARTLSFPPSGPLTIKVVTLWYRAPELLLGGLVPQLERESSSQVGSRKRTQSDLADSSSSLLPDSPGSNSSTSNSIHTAQYSFAVDLWSAGCILAELLLGKPLLPGDDEMDQLQHIFRLLGCPSEKIWPDLPRMALVMNRRLNLALEQTQHPHNTTWQALSSALASTSRSEGVDLINQLLLYNPSVRITAHNALRHAYLHSRPYPSDVDFMPTFPSIHDDTSQQQALSITS